MKVKIEYVKNDHKGEPFHVWKKDDGFLGFFWGWRETYSYSTLPAAEEFAKSREEHVVYLGVFENGVRKAMTDWEDAQLKVSQTDVLSLRSKSYDGYKPELNRVDGAPVKDPKFFKPAINKELEVKVEVESKFLRKELRK